MAKKYRQKLKLLYVLEILKNFSDEQNPLTAEQICNFLEEKGIFAERKSIYDDIEMLTDYGYDIIKAGKRGVFLGEREFEISEIYLLSDAVRSAKFISAKKTRVLISKLDSMLSENQVKLRKKNIFFDYGTKCDNEEIYYNIYTINQAIEQNKRIAFQYLVRELSNDRTVVRRSKDMIISPYALTWQDDHYYLIGNYSKYNNLIHLRLDRMKSVEIINKKARPFSEVSGYEGAFDISDYTKRLFSMHGGELMEIEFRCNKGIIEQVADRFSENIFIRDVGEDEFSFSVQAAISDALVTWIINYGNNITVISPAKLRKMVYERAQQVLNQYNT